MKPIKIATVKIFASKLRKYEGFCDKRKRNQFKVYLNIPNISTHEKFFSLLIHELVHMCLSLIRDRNLTFLLSGKNKESKVVRVSERDFDRIEEDIASEIEESALKIFEKYRSKL